MFCDITWNPIYLIFSSKAPVILYYSHLPIAFIALFLSFFVYKNNKTLVSKLLSSLAIVFVIWVFLDLIVWVNDLSTVMSFAWSFFGLVTSLIFILSAYLSYVFLFKKDVSLKTKILTLLFLLPIIIFTPTLFSIQDFDTTWCVANESTTFMIYYYTIGLIYFLVTLFLGIKKIFYTKDSTKKKEAVYFTTGICLFLLAFGFTSFLASYLTDSGIVPSYSIEPYGLFGMVIFMTFLAYLIVKFKSFNIKLIATQALVWGVIILIGSQFFFIQNPTNKILNSVTLIISSVLGFSIVRSVKKEVALREELEVANNNQQSLIHFISHQLKGFFTKSKMIFAGILEGDFGESSTNLKEVVKEGLLSDDNAVSMIQSILGASNLKKGTTTYNMKEVDFSNVLKKVCDGFIKEFENRGLELKFNIPEIPIKILADSTQIDQVVKNLVDNSLKYTLKGSIEVSLSSLKKDGKDKVLLTIKDTGVGLSESDKKKLFTEGGKGDESLKVNVNSTGYGLYIVKKIVENHGGKIWAESEGRGLGSKFCVELNLVK
ncbi:MAG: ATP-binding protein [Planctomycetes bacterium]|jgi:signal transduction histidine kinase|nr:ATP-binding protein [Planctomycetota bacterium]